MAPHLKPDERNFVIAYYYNTSRDASQNKRADATAAEVLARYNRDISARQVINIVTKALQPPSLEPEKENPTRAPVARAAFKDVVMNIISDPAILHCAKKHRAKSQLNFLSAIKQFRRS